MRRQIVILRMSFKGIQKEDCGYRFLSREGVNKYIGNACFFCCLYSGLITAIPEDFTILSLVYEDFLDSGGWSKDFKGEMVDTFYNAGNLHRLALHFGVKIFVYTELAPNIVYMDAFNRFGSDGPTINIVRLLNSAHFNLMKFSDDPLSLEEVESAQRKLEKQLKKDEEYAKKIEEQLRLQYEQEQSDALLAQSIFDKFNAEQLQIEKDEILARNLACI